MAASADEVIAKLQDTVVCPVCFEQFKEPRSLPCQHSFCTECLEGVLGTGTKIRCPCCKKKTPVPNGVQDLPVDFRANTQLEILSMYQNANMAEAAVVVEAEVVLPQDAFGRMSLDEHCPVCQEIPTVSNNLSCCHSVCESCVQFLLTVGGVTLHCPTCSRQTTIVVTSNTGPHTPSVQSRRETGPAERLTFHSVCGKNAVIHANRITAHRKDPQNTFHQALVQTSRHLKPNELFEVQLDKKVDERLGSIDIGVTKHSPTESALPAYLFDLDSDTWFMLGSKVCHKEGNTRTDIKEYKQDLDDLEVGDRVGVQRRVSGNLHFYINGADLGVAASDVPADMYGIIDLFGKAEQVTITDTSGTHPGEATY